MWFRVLDPQNNREMVYNTDHITKIEVRYYIPSETEHTAPTGSNRSWR
ncbi:MAG TPA: hypothetical protein VEI07_15085 [Planctomycetaceae bacterium]|nr:hypothetical protein [Planctomycetaceae bacterium]